MKPLPHEQIVIPPLEAFLITPQFVASDLWVWPLFLIVSFFMMRGYHRTAGLTGRDVDLVIGLKALNGLFLWGILIGLSRAVHRATDDVIVSGLWTGVALTLTTGGLQLVFKHSPIAPSFRRVQDAIAQYRLRIKEEGKARKEAARRGETAFDVNGATLQTYVTPDSAADAKRHVSALMRRDLFNDPSPMASTIVEPAPETEKPPVA